MNPQDSHETRSRLVLACLGVASRFRLVRALAESERCVGELAVAVGLSQSCTTRHLQALQQVGLVKGHREGRRVRFRLRADAPGLATLLGWALSGEVPGADQSRGDGLAGGDLHRDREGSRPYLPSASEPGGRAVHRARQNRGSRPRVESIRPAGPSPGSRAVASDPGQEESERISVASNAPPGRPGDLEDYLL
jgi:DNA-binding transcriptional ArsR family regulator